jgi:CelD/BcsL family acetyltransferase involved in cellulose biosynthesis
VIGVACLVASTARRRFVPFRGFHLNATGDAAIDGITIEHNGWVCAADDRPALDDALVAWFAAKPMEADELHLPGLTVSMAVRGRGLTETTEAKPAFAVDLDRVRAAGDLGALISSNARQQARRAMRLYDVQGGVRLVEARTREEALAFFTDLKTFHIASWERRRRRHAFTEPFFERFHRALIERCFDRGNIQLLRVAVGAEAIGYLYNLRKAGRIYAYQSGFADGDPRLRPGAVSHWLAVAHNAARGERVYDFMAGDNRLKRSFATEHYELYWQTIRQPHFKYRLEDGARWVKRRLLGAPD